MASLKMPSLLKSHPHCVMVPAPTLEASVKVIGLPRQTPLDEPKEGVGFGLTVILNDIGMAGQPFRPALTTTCAVEVVVPALTDVNDGITLVFPFVVVMPIVAPVGELQLYDCTPPVTGIMLIFTGAVGTLGQYSTLGMALMIGVG